MEYFHCTHCGFLQTEEPYWLDEAYKSPINISDTGYMLRNNQFAQKLSIILYLRYGQKGRFLDYAAGYGVFVRMMRDIGFDFYWNDKFTENLLAKGFDGKLEGKYEAITGFEVLEHFVEPRQEIENLLMYSNTLIFSTELYPNYHPKPQEWWYFGLEHGQHISFYSEKTFNYLAKELGLTYQRLGSLHFLSKTPFSPWHFKATKGIRFGLDRMLTRKMKSKTWEDFEKVVNELKQIK